MVFFGDAGVSSSKSRENSIWQYLIPFSYIYESSPGVLGEGYSIKGKKSPDSLSLKGLVGHLSG